MLKVLWFVPPAIALLGQAEHPGAAVAATRTRGSDEQFKQLTAGGCDLAVTAMDNVIGWNARPGGGDFRVIAQIENTTPLFVFARPEIGSLAAVKGRRILVDSAENGFVVALLKLLHDAGLARDELNLVPAGGVSERGEALAAGEGDVTLLGPPFDGIAEQKGLVRLASVNAAYPAFPGQGIVARRALLRERADEVRAWLGALEAGRRLALSAPERARTIVEAAGMPGPVAQAMVKAAPKSLVPDRDGVDLLIAQRRSLGLRGGDYDYGALVDTVWLEPSEKDSSR